MMLVFLLHKYKDGDVHNGFIGYTIHGHRREVDLEVLREVSLKQAREYITAIVFFWAFYFT
ncbi:MULTISPECIES: DUF4102 domain-containing protein [unclassified Bartonella]|uniref:DUF4102 domain-containing protein n=1 Tax=unclassified Bartonella TaxID=2645622 RepID=UPI0035CF0656